MPSIPQLAQALHAVLVDAATQAANASRFVQRQRRISGPLFVQSFVGSLLANPDASYEDMVALAADLGVCITPQAFAERLTPAAVSCLEQVLAATTQHVLTAEPAVLPLLDRFVAVEVQDSTTIALADCLSHQFQGCGGSVGRVKAAVKAQFRWELRSGRLDGPLLQDGRASDRAIDFRARSPRGTLRLRDIGYWHLDDLAHDDRDGRLWLMRLKPGTALYTPDGQRRELAALLAEQTEDRLDLVVELGVAQRLACRLLARRVSKEEAAARVRRAERTARRKGRSVSATTRALCGWDVLVTNVPLRLLSGEEAWVMQRVRWQIELLFKLWKQHGKVDESRGQQPARLLAELYAKFIGLLIQHWLLLAGCWADADRSLVKGARVVRRWAERVFRALNDRTRLEQVLGEVVAALRRSRRQTRRKADPNTWQLLGGLPANR